MSSATFVISLPLATFFPQKLSTVYNIVETLQLPLSSNECTGPPQLINSHKLPQRNITMYIAIVHPLA